MNNISQVLKQRASSKLKKSFVNTPSKNVPIVLTSSSDQGVQRNGGKLGARFAPKCILNELGKLEVHEFTPKKIFIKEVCKKFENFNQSQIHQIEMIKTYITNSRNKILHLGGGHDHIYPFLLNLSSFDNIQKLLILNIDAHLDTRTDKFPHSGTPFRQFAQNSKKPSTIIQLGVHKETNHQSNYEKLESTSMTTEEFFNLEDLAHIKRKILSIYDTDTLIVLSIDCDGIDLNHLSAVSAPNPYGTPFELVLKLIHFLSVEKNICHHMGLYELNPIFDHVNNLSARKAAWLAYKFLQSSK